VHIGIAVPLRVAASDVSQPTLDAVIVTVALPESTNPLLVTVLEVRLTEPEFVEMLYVAGSRFVILKENELTPDVAEPRVGVVTFWKEVPDVLDELDNQPFRDTVTVHVAKTFAPIPATVTFPSVCVTVPAKGEPIKSVNPKEYVFKLL